MFARMKLLPKGTWSAAAGLVGALILAGTAGPVDAGTSSPGGGDPHAPAWKVALYGERITPTGTDARLFSRPGWGGGVRGVYSPTTFAHGLGLAAGFDVANLLDQTTVLIDPNTHLRVEQNTSQYFMRFAAGVELGPHGRGFLRPFVGANLALHLYTIGTTLTVPDDNDPNRSIHQDLGSETRAAPGYDLTAGADLHYHGFSVEGGARFLKSFNVPQQLGNASAVHIHPGYVQVFVGIAVSAL